MKQIICLLLAIAAITVNAGEKQEPDATSGVEWTPPRYIPPPPPVPEPVYDPENLAVYPNLSTEMLKAIPRLRLDMHYYHAEPKQRFVQINQMAAREGLPIGRELWVREIRENGVVIQFEKQFFLLQP